MIQAIIAITGITIFIILCTMYALSLRKIVPTNEVHVIQNGNKTIVYGKNSKTGNVYYAVPTWVPKYGVTVTKLPSTVINLSLKDFFVRDKNMLPFQVDIKAYAVVEDFIPAANRVFTLGELKDHLTGTIQSIVTSTFAKEQLKDIMEKRTEYNDGFTNECTPQFQEWGVKPLGKIELIGISDVQDFGLVSAVEKKQKELFIEYL